MSLPSVKVGVMKYLKKDTQLLRLNDCASRAELCIEEITLDELKSILGNLSTPIRERFFRILWTEDG